jgi:hypothetical protein
VTQDAAGSKPAPRGVHPQQSGLEPYLADPNVLVGVDVPTREVLMVEICVAVQDATRARGLISRLGRVFDGSSVLFDSTRSEVQVRSEWESRCVVQVLGAVESWLAEDGPDSARLSIGDRSYTMLAPTPLGARNGWAA